MTSKLKLRYILLWAAFLFQATAPLGAETRTITLEAKPNGFAFANLSTKQSTGQLIVSTSLTLHSGHSGQLPAATIGYADDILHKNSFQIRLFLPDPTTESLQLKYLLYTDGAVVQQAILKSDLAPLSQIKVSISHNKGLFEISINDGPIVIVTTTLTSVTPYITAISAKVSFEIISIDGGSE